MHVTGFLYVALSLGLVKSILVLAMRTALESTYAYDV